MALLASLAPLLAGCTWQGYAVSRGIRTVTGTRTQVHTIVPVTTTLRQYRAIEVQPFDNLVPAMPSELERFLNDSVADALGQLETAPSVVRPDLADSLSDGQASSPSELTLVLAGVIDDYDPGYVGLRLVELGLNHQVITVRIQLQDKATGRIVGAASITSQDKRVIATARETIGRIAAHVRAFVETGYGE